MSDEAKKHDFKLSDDELDEFFVSGADIHVERMNTAAFWIDISHPSLPGLSINTGVHRGVWFFNVQNNSEDDEFFNVQRPRKSKPVELPKLAELRTVLAKTIAISDDWRQRCEFSVRECTKVIHQRDAALALAEQRRVEIESLSEMQILGMAWCPNCAKIQEVDFEGYVNLDVTGGFVGGDVVCSDCAFIITCLYRPIAAPHTT